jgi:hypothetical protein
VTTKSTVNDAMWTGTLTLKDAAGNTLAVLPPTYDAGEYRWIKFYPICTQALTYNVRAIMQVPDLVNDDDWPQFDSDYHDLLISGPGSEVLPLVGKRNLGAQMANEYARKSDTFAGTQQRKPNLILGFTNVSNALPLNDRSRINSVDGVVLK